MQQDPCPCGSDKPFGACCERYLVGTALPDTAQALMRSRYTAYAKQNIAYLKDTLWPKYQPEFDSFAVSKWASESHWVGLEILSVEKGTAKDRDGTVLFEARYLSAGALALHRELSLFRKKSGRWYYVEALPQG
ncbi:YchJ family protein [Cohaesibacter celericrescens]|uniref:YchJ family protein n=1 Tax=Cohaesibacter celericrescens TaxID=2067669 RepID=UPI003564455E